MVVLLVTIKWLMDPREFKFGKLLLGAETPRNREFENHIIEDARAEAAAARADAAAANGKAAKVETWVHNLEIKFEEFQRRMLALESGSCSGPSRHNSHPHYDADFDNQLTDEDV
ncbi:hypothetical protein A2U01_0037377 [Trifolium medium]|uniref:Uncharacterized protein n=1 Tax=Trifolium medium TaxID=97028 RepID=A0A392PZ31_9FABA|nr:hypothetical protein [Trifolium medium]